MWVRYLVVLMLIFLFIGTACSQGMGDSKEYDYLGTPVISSDQAQQQSRGLDKSILGGYAGMGSLRSRVSANTWKT